MYKKIQKQVVKIFEKKPGKNIFRKKSQKRKRKTKIMAADYVYCIE